MVIVFKVLLNAAIFYLLSFSLFAMEKDEGSRPALISSSPQLPEQDEFDFLLKKRSDLVEEAGKPFTYCSEETKHYRKLRALAEEEASQESALIEGAKTLLEKKTLHWFGAEHERFVLDQIQPMIAKLQQNHPTNGYFNIFFRRALENHTCLESILLASEYIFQTVRDEGGGAVLFLGRTPCVVQVAYEELLKVEGDGTQVSVHLNFSGHPDALTKRESDFFRSNINIARDMVTPDKLSHYFSYLDTRGILRVKKLYIVDILGSGSSLNSFLRVINVYYQRRGSDIPALFFLNLTADINWSIDKPECYTFEQRGNVSNQGLLTLPEDKKKNMKPFQIPVYGIPIFDKILTDILDQDMFQELLVHGIQYPAQKWTPEFDAQRAEGGKYHLRFYEYLRRTFLQLIGSHNLLLRDTSS